MAKTDSLTIAWVLVILIAFVALLFFAGILGFDEAGRLVFGFPKEQVLSVVQQAPQAQTPQTIGIGGGGAR